MVVFILLAVLSVAGLAFRLSSLRFRAASTVEGKTSKFSWRAYFSWLERRGRELGLKRSFARGGAVLKGWAAGRYPGVLGWIFAALIASFLYQAASGFFFALFIPRGMFGLPLLVHVVSGGLFALSLAAMLFWRARDYGFERREPPAGNHIAGPFFKGLSRPAQRKIAFWAFAFFGFVQVATALGSMLPLFTFQAQLAMIMIHRYGALVLLLAAILFADLAFLPPPNKYGDISLNCPKTNK
jgi:hypothetical protein